MTGKAKQATRIIIIAAAAIAAATLCVVLAFAFAFNNEAALCGYLQSKGVAAEDLAALLDDYDKAAVAFEGEEEEYFEGADALYSLAATAAEKADTARGAINAYYDAPAAGNPFSLIAYASLYGRLKDFAAEKDSLELTANKEDLRAAAEQILLVCERITELGKENFDEAARTLYNVMSSENVLEEVSYKSMIKLALYAVDATSDVEFSKTAAITDTFFSSGFTKAHAEGLDSAAVVIRSLDYDGLLSLFGYLPDTGLFASAVCRYANGVDSFDKDAFCGAFAAAINGLLAEKGVQTKVNEADVAANFGILAAADPDALTESDRKQISSAAEYFESCFALFSNENKGDQNQETQSYIR